MPLGRKIVGLSDTIGVAYDGWILIYPAYHVPQGEAKRTSKKAQGGKKGYFSGQKNVTGRQLARVSAIKYRETIWSEIYAGNRHTITCLRPAVEAVESSGSRNSIIKKLLV